MNKTAIEWTDFSSNPLKFRDAKTNQIVWGCVKVSPGCAACYSEALALRYKRGKLFNSANMRELKPFMCEDELREMRTKKKAGGVEVSGKRCFVGDMTDLFGEWVTDGMLDSLFRAMADRKDVTFQILTKRAERMQKYFANRWGTFGGQYYPPPPNIHAGVSVEDQPRADKRIVELLQTPAAVRFLSCEPLLGPINLERLSDGKNGWTDCLGGVWGHGFSSDHEGDGTEDIPDGTTGDGIISWVIIGGESGPGARPCNIEWIRDIVRQCKAASVPCFVKQLGSRPFVREEGYPHIAGDVRKPHLEGDGFGNYYVTLKDKKGGDMSEWPADLRIREFPRG
jgi:protein gp37